MAHTSHLLRPVFTRRLAQRLHSGAVMNLIGREEDGMSRLLDDLMGMEIEGLRMIRIDMREFSHSAIRIVEGLSLALGFDEPAEDLNEIMDALQLHGGRFCLILHHADQIRDAASAGFNDSFWAALQRVAFIPTLSLVLVTRQPWEIRLTNVDKFLAQADLDPEPHKLPPLSFKRFGEELQRRSGSREPVTEAVVNVIFSHRQPYPFLEYVAERLASAGMSPAQLSPATLAQWQQAFDIAHGQVPAEEKPAAPWWKRWLGGWQKGS